MKIKHNLDNPIENKLEVNWFKMVWFTSFAAIILSLGIVIGATLSNIDTSQSYFVANYGSPLKIGSSSNGNSSFGTLHFGLTSSIGSSVSSNNEITYYQPSILRVIVSRVLVYSSNSGKWINIPVSDVLVNLLKYDNGNVGYLSTDSIPTGSYTKEKIYFKYLASVLNNNNAVNIPLYNTSITFSKSFNIISGGNTYIAPVFNINQVVGKVGGNYIFSPNISGFNVDY